MSPKSQTLLGFLSIDIRHGFYFVLKLRHIRRTYARKPEVCRLLIVRCSVYAEYKSESDVKTKG